MALSSQVPRTGMSRQYMSSRRRKPKRWPWLVVMLIGVGFGIWYLMSGESTSTAPIDPAQANATADNDTTANPTDTGTNGSNTTANPSNPRFSLNLNANNRVPSVPADPPPQTNNTNTQTTTANVPTFTLGADTNPPRGTNQTPPPAGSGNDTGNTTPPPPVVSGGSGDFARGMALIEQGNLVEGRALLSELLFAANPPSLREQQQIREVLTGVNNMLIFSRDRMPNDPVTVWHEIRSGDSYHRVAPKYAVPHEFLQMINQVDPTRLQVGKSMKVVKGPFHVRVLKNQYLMDVYLVDDQERPVFVTAFPVGLGEDDSTPIGQWVVTPGRKVKNPSWRNPRTGEFFTADSPDNPIGEHWIALSGVDENTANKQGYGIHGTIDPESIGDQMSMGCIRLRNEDVALVYNMLTGGQSTVQIAP